MYTPNRWLSVIGPIGKIRFLTEWGCPNMSHKLSGTKPLFCGQVISSYVGWSYGPWSSGPIMTGIPLKEQQVMHPHHGTHGTQSKLTISGWIKGATGFLQIFRHPKLVDHGIHVCLWHIDKYSVCIVELKLHEFDLIMWQMNKWTVDITTRILV